MPIERDSDTNCYKIFYSIDNEKIDSLFVYKFGQKTRIINSEIKGNELLLLYTSNGTNSITKGLTIIIERYLGINDKIVRQSSISISKQSLKGYEVHLKNGVLELSENNLIKQEYQLSEYLDLTKLIKEIFAITGFME